MLSSVEARGVAFTLILRGPQGDTYQGFLNQINTPVNKLG